MECRGGQMNPQTGAGMRPHGEMLQWEVTACLVRVESLPWPQSESWGTSSFTVHVRMSSCKSPRRAAALALAASNDSFGSTGACTEYRANKEEPRPSSSFLPTGRRMSENASVAQRQEEARNQPVSALLETGHVALGKPMALSVSLSSLSRWGRVLVFFSERRSYHQTLNRVEAGWRLKQSSCEDVRRGLDAAVNHLLEDKARQAVAIPSLPHWESPMECLHERDSSSSLFLCHLFVHASSAP
ncbi:hypothetical protein J3F83DRAFT_120089 [Trichoderma novae-zelandiae]